METEIAIHSHGLPFEFPAAGTFGNHIRNSIEGPGRWGVDLALATVLDLQ